jgi:Zn-finger nucleic acid-binding protein
MHSKNESEYFAKRDAELRAHLHAKEVAEIEAAERRSHLMRCPRCGGKMQHVELHGVVIDKCPDCQGIFLDDGELKVLAARHEETVLDKVFNDFRKAFSNKTDTK